MIPKHEGYLGALAPENLNKTAPGAAVQPDGHVVRRSERELSADFRYGPPYPEFIGQAKLDYEVARKRCRRQPYRDAIGQCFPAGIPMLMTRVWPIAMVQLPTVIYMVSNFNNGFRQIFLDGRPLSDPDKVIFTYNGESMATSRKTRSSSTPVHRDVQPLHRHRDPDLREVPHAGADPVCSRTARCSRSSTS